MAASRLRDQAEALYRLTSLALQRPDRGAAYQGLVQAESHVAVAATLFLLDVPAAGGAAAAETKPAPVDIEDFIVHSLARLLQHPARRTEQLQVEYRGRVSGRVVWPGTYKARHSEDCDPSRFVCREVRRQYDTPENQLVKFVVEAIAGCLQAIPDVIKAGLCIRPGTAGGEHTMLPHTLTRLGRIEAGVNSFRRNAYMRGVTRPERLSELHRLRAQDASLDEYRLALHACDRYLDLVAHPDQQKIGEIGIRLLAVPGCCGPAAEPWLAFAASQLGNRPGG